MEIIRQEEAWAVDTAIGELQDRLSMELPWLERVYGRAERTVKDVSGRRAYTPCIYVGGNDYRDLSPDSTLGNSVFFWVHDPQEFDALPRERGEIKAVLSAVFWLDMRTVDDGLRNRGAVSESAVSALNTPLENGRFEARRVYELAENVYQGFSLDEVQNQFLMHPYWGFRVEGTLTVKEVCHG